MEYAIVTLGCKVNQYDSNVLSELMKQEGFFPAEDDKTADIYIVNSCTVTENGDKKARHAIIKLRRENPDAVIVLTGCYPQAFPEEAKLITQADIITGTADRKLLPRQIGDFLKNRGRVASLLPTSSRYEELTVHAETDKTRAYVKIEDGCDRFCSYCIIPTARGRVRSRLPENIANEVKIQAEAGHKEIVLVGINLSCYGKDIDLRLSDAVKLTAENPLVQRVRLSSLEPELLTEDHIAELAEVDKLCPHFHLSLQSGSNATLRRMNRHYTAEEYSEIVENLRLAFPNCAVTTDIMVGFAGETEEEFEQSLTFAEKIGFAKIHVFTYSVREGTAAAKRTDHLPLSVKNERYKRMTALADAQQQKFFEKQIGTRQKLLVEKRVSPDYINGYTENYTPVRVYGATAKRHEIIDIEITEKNDGFCVGICK